MANRIRSTCVIIDSTGAVPYPGNGAQAKVSFIAFWAANSTGAMQIATQSSTNDVIVNMASPVDLPNTTTFRFPGNQYLQSLTVKTLTAGTGYLYFA